tara:strand:+ start:8255 stop:10210 length:1956 start_codon:yes stop_codon:yes gene_type:complete
MAKRKYTKKSNYWNKFNKVETKASQSEDSVEPATAGEAYHTSLGSYSRTGSISNLNEKNTSTRINRSSVTAPLNKFSQIRAGLLPYEISSDGINVREAIELCQKAYANVPIFRNTIDMMSEFANAEVYLEGGNATSRDFFKKLFDRIKLWDLKDQYFREYYRSGNIFLYRLDGKFDLEDFKKFSKIVENTPRENKFPLKYIVLNPFEIVAKRSTVFNTKDGAYAKILSEFDMERLANPKNDYDRAVFNALDPEDQKLIKDGAYFKDGLKINLENERLAYSFYKKQDYEPFAIPFGYPVLEDINAKMEMKKMDQAIMRTVENVILMITMGAEPEKGGINSNNVRAMQKLFQNESVGRVLVSDYTTKADFVIPDINKVVGVQKYEVINQDIKEGLQNIILNEDKYSGAQIKARVFLDRLKEAREAFINDFLQPEIQRISKDLGFRQYPTVKFKDIDLRDETQLMRVATRLMELGVLTAEQGMTLFHTGRFPKAEELEKAQDKFVDQREKGYFNPIVGGIPMIQDEEDQPKTKPTNGMPGRPEGSEDQFSRANIQQTIYEIENLRNIAFTKLREKLKVGKKGFSKEQSKMVDRLCESVVCATEKENWSDQVISCVNDFNVIEKLGALDGVLNISESHKLELYPSAILYHSNERN